MKTLPLILALAAFGIFAASCGTDHSQMRVVHASPDAPNLDITFDGTSFATDLQYGTVSPATGYTTVKSGNRQLQVFATGTTTNPLISTNPNLSGGHHYTILVSGDVNPAPGTIAAVVVTDSTTAPSSGNVNLRVIHDSPSAPMDVDVYIVTPGTDITNLTPNISTLTYQQASNYQAIAAGPLQVIVTATGDGSKTPLVNQTYPDLTSGQVRTFVVLDNVGGGSVAISPLELADLN